MRIDWNQKELMAEFEAACDEVAEAGAQKIASDMRSTTLFKDKTGNLRKSIAVHKSRFKGGGYVVGAWAPHAHLIEFGTTERFQKTGFLQAKSVGAVRPRPFVQQAIERNRRRIQQSFANKIK